jgi:ABC-type multidrug transport system ATPase subunit
MLLKITNLNKQYANGIKALDNVSLEISKGMYGLLGPNGAGKSSLMRTIATLQEADSGSIFMNDTDIIKEKDLHRKQLGYLPQEFGVYPKVSAFDMLDHIAMLKGINQGRKDWVHTLLNQVNLYNFRNKNVSEFSGGMRQRFGIAQALIGNPNLLIVDEPTAGLDPTERNRFHNILAEIAEDKIVILSTHIVQDVIELCNKMAIINKGKVMFEGLPNEALQMMENKVYGKFVDKNELIDIKENYHVLSEKLLSGKTYVHIYANESPSSTFEMLKPDLEDVFFFMTQS